MTGIVVSRDKLNAIMEIDHVIQVHENGTVTTEIGGFWAPECHIDSSLPYGERDSATHPYRE